ncbi:MAG: Rpn family recombination-promoting nuclease/putative transposase [Planctomycetes bacterium]|nr:Rpn family recombination-promoting nuclease/putative transposase [Planctomycetota bacterium]
MEPTPHDALFRAIFSQPRHAEAELRAALPREWAAAIEWGTLTLRDGTLVDDELRRRTADLLFEARRHDGEPTLLLFLMEHQSTSDRRMALRLLGYQTRILERWAVEQPDARRLPTVLSLLLHQGAKPWPWPATFAGSIGGTPLPLVAGTPAPLDFGFFLDDLATQSDAQLLVRGEDAVVKLTLLALRHGRAGERLVELLIGAFEALANDLRGSGAAKALEMLARYVCNASPEPATALRRVAAAALPHHVRSPFMTLADNLRAEGRAEGRAAGELRALREMLGELLAERFGPLDGAAIGALDGADAGTLRRWIRQFVRANSVAELLAS